LIGSASARDSLGKNSILTPPAQRPAFSTGFETRNGDPRHQS